jgi:haloacetate dehalogenase
MFDGFEEFDIATAGTTIHGRRGGQGPPVLLLHGIPRNASDVALGSATTRRTHVVATDLRGFGASGTPPSTPDHAPYSMREIARDQVEIMNALGYGEFAVAGHYRGARCAYRMDLPPGRCRPSYSARHRPPPVRRSAARTWPAASVLGVVVPGGPVPGARAADRRAPEVFVNHMLHAWSDGADVFPRGHPRRLSRLVP